MESLAAQLGLPRRVDLSVSVWAAAAVLGRLRTEVNDAHRSDVRDRGRAKNLRNDLQGSLGELVGQQVLDRAGLGQPTIGLLDLHGPVDRPDLVADTDPPTALDAKCHLDEPGKSRFLVNERARQRSARRGVAAFLPVVAAGCRSWAYLGAPVGIGEVAGWDEQTLGAHHDPARALPLPDLDRRHLGGHRLTWGTTAPAARDRQWGPPVLGWDTLEQAAGAVDAALLGRLRTSGFTLDGLTGRQACNRLVSLLPSPLQAALQDPQSRARHGTGPAT